MAHQLSGTLAAPRLTNLFRQLAWKKCTQRPDEPLLVLLSSPAALDGQDAMDIGRDRGLSS
jgi:hypothetical protein